MPKVSGNFLARWSSAEVILYHQTFWISEPRPMPSYCVCVKKVNEKHHAVISKLLVYMQNSQISHSILLLMWNYIWYASTFHVCICLPVGKHTSRTSNADHHAPQGYRQPYSLPLQDKAQFKESAQCMMSMFCTRLSELISRAFSDARTSSFIETLVTWKSSLIMLLS